MRSFIRLQRVLAKPTNVNVRVFAEKAIKF